MQRSGQAPTPGNGAQRWWVGDPVAFAEVVGRGSRLPAARISAATAEVAHRVGAEVAEVVVKDVIVPLELRAAPPGTRIVLGMPEAVALAGGGDPS